MIQEFFLVDFVPPSKFWDAFWKFDTYFVRSKMEQGTSQWHQRWHQRWIMGTPELLRHSLQATRFKHRHGFLGGCLAWYTSFHLNACRSNFQTQGNPTFFRYLNLVVRCMTIQSIHPSFFWWIWFLQVNSLPFLSVRPIATWICLKTGRTNCLKISRFQTSFSHTFPYTFPYTFHDFPIVVSGWGSISISCTDTPGFGGILWQRCAGGLWPKWSPKDFPAAQWNKTYGDHGGQRTQPRCGKSMKVLEEFRILAEFSLEFCNVLKQTYQHELQHIVGQQWYAKV